MGLSKKNINLLIPDGESHLLLEVATCLSEIRGLKVFVISSNPDNPMKYSRHVHHFFHIERKGQVSDWLSQIDLAVTQWDIDFIMPIFEIGIKDLIANRELLQSKDKLMLWPNLDCYETAIDKWQLYRHMLKEDIPCPNSFLVEYQKPKHVSFPMVVKPTKGYGGGMGVKLIEDQMQWKTFKAKVADTGITFMAQEYILGDDYCCNVYCHKGKILRYTIQKGTMWGGNRFGPQTGHEIVYRNEVLEVSAQLMKSLLWSGVACIDIRLDESTKTFKIIEVNARYWRSLLGSLSAGMNFPKCAIYHHLELEMPKQDYKQKIYLNLKGLIQYLKGDFRRGFKFGFLWKNTALKYAIFDPLPMVYKFFTRRW